MTLNKTSLFRKINLIALALLIAPTYAYAQNTKTQQFFTEFLETSFSTEKQPKNITDLTNYLETHLADDFSMSVLARVYINGEDLREKILNADKKSYMSIISMISAMFANLEVSIEVQSPKATETENVMAIQTKMPFSSELADYDSNTPKLYSHSTGVWHCQFLYKENEKSLIKIHKMDCLNEGITSLNSDDT